MTLGLIVIGGFIATKLLRWRAPLGMSVALTAMYGFPADYLLTNEVARSIARVLRADEDLTEAIALAHDLGHTPFGHAGEKALEQAMERWLELESESE